MAELKIKRFKLKENADVSSVPLQEHKLKREIGYTVRERNPIRKEEAK